MQPIFKSGRYLFALAVITFGIIQIITANFLSSLFPVPDALPGRRLFLYFFSVLFIAGGAGIIISKTSSAARATGILFFVMLIYPHLPKLINDIHNGGEWTVFAETAAFCGGAFIVGVAQSEGFTDPGRRENIRRTILRSGRFIFAGALLVFGILHLQYAGYIATLIPHWIPIPLFWSYFVGVAFIAGAASILLKIKIRLACSLLGFMFLFWVFFVHAPRVMANPYIETEWTSLFVATGFCGIFFTLGADPNLTNKSWEENP